MQQSGSQDPQQYYAYMYPTHSAEASQVLSNNYGYYAGALQLGPGAAQASPPAASPTDLYLTQQFQQLTMSPFTPAFYSSQPYAEPLSPNYSVPSANASVQTTTNHTNETSGGMGSGRSSPNKFGPKRGGRGGARAPRQNEQQVAPYPADSAAVGASEQFPGGNFAAGHYQNGPATGASNANIGADGAVIVPRGGYRGRGRGGPRGRGRGRGFRGAGSGGFGLFAPPSSALGSEGEPTGAAGAGPGPGSQPNASWYNRALVTTVAKLQPADVQAQPMSDTQERVNPRVMRDLDAQTPRYFVIKSFCEDDVHHSVKYGVWCSTERGNRILDFAFQSQQSSSAGTPQPVYLFYSVNGSGHFCGIAEMKSRVDYTRKLGNWEQDRWRGIFEVEWIYVKDVPNSELRHIQLPNNENKPVTYSRDTQVQYLHLQKSNQPVECSVLLCHLANMRY